LAFALFAGAAPAFASVHIITFEGTIESGYDSGNLFGFAGGSLAGQTYVQKFTYDTSIGARFTTPEYDNLFGGTAYKGSPVTGGFITINSITRDITTADNSLLYLGITTSGQTGLMVNGQQSQILSDVDLFSSSLGNLFFPIAGPYSLDDDLSLVSGTPNLGNGNFFNIKISPHQGTPTETFGYLHPSSVAISSLGTSGNPGLGGSAPGAVPEPASWTMMIAGFGLVGGAMRRRKHLSPSLLDTRQGFLSPA